MKEPPGSAVNIIWLVLYDPQAPWSTVLYRLQETSSVPIPQWPQSCTPTGSIASINHFCYLVQTSEIHHQTSTTKGWSLEHIYDNLTF